MAFVDYYKILGVDKNIPQKDVRAAYRTRYLELTEGYITKQFLDMSLRA